jgi:hypothetical protein
MASNNKYRIVNESVLEKRNKFGFIIYLSAIIIFSLFFSLSGLNLPKIIFIFFCNIGITVIWMICLSEISKTLKKEVSGDIFYMIIRKNIMSMEVCIHYYEEKCEEKHLFRLAELKYKKSIFHLMWNLKKFFIFISECDMLKITRMTKGDKYIDKYFFLEVRKEKLKSIYNDKTFLV